MAQDTSTAAQAPQTPAASAPAPEAPAPAAPSEAAPTAPAAPEAVTPPAPAAPAPATQAAPPGMRMLRGRTFDKSSNDAVPLVRVIIKGTTKGTETDVNGYFTLEIPEGAVVLDISSQDYKQREVLVPATQRSVNVPLEASFTEELVVVGRASEVARKNLANSVATVNAEALNR
ncbi:carboxypeptidase-like regulatory domain-containing protein, partial [Hyalangium sp.]|uniref:carboxypeptidase-like regulatory domain-containing protein n=1 Tax=Hyalangium sp. TaxID=2028555 RepID=UPI002D58C8C1